MTAAETWRVTRGDDGVAVVTFDHPPVNVLDYATYDALSLRLDELESDERVRAVVFQSLHEKIYISGADINDMESYDRRRGAAARKVDTVHAVFLRLQRFAKPTVGALTGHALGGGCEFALCLDFRLMTEGRPRIGLPEVGLGIVPGGGGTQRLARLVGRAKATELLLLGGRLSAAEAQEAGLVNRLYPDADRTRAAAIELARQLAGQPPAAVRLVKRALNDGVDGDLVRGLAVEREAVIEALATEDAREGPRAFLEKRRPRWTGR